jgi:hypothetical protein
MNLPPKSAEQARARVEAALARGSACLEEATMTDEERARVWRRLTRAAPRRTSSARWVVALAACGALALAVFVTSDGAPHAARSHPSGGREDCTLDAQAERLALRSDCPSQSVSVGADAWQLEPGALVRREPSGARVERGSVTFRVRKRATASFVVHVSHGLVRVIGTSFRIAQQTERGSIEVTEGVIEFEWSDGTHERVRTGQSLRWPRPIVATTPRIEADGSEVEPIEVDAGVVPARHLRKQHAPAHPLDLDGTLERLFQLKSQARFDELIALLRSALHAPGGSRVQRERLSYELGLALEASARDACVHWRQHLQTYGQGQHGDALVRRLERCERERGDR